MCGFLQQIKEFEQNRYSVRNSTGDGGEAEDEQGIIKVAYPVTDPAGQSEAVGEISWSIHYYAFACPEQLR